MKKIIFLDIDGVLQPTSSQKRFKHDMDKLKKQLAEEEDERYKDMDKYDIAAVFYDWDPDAVKNLKSLCENAQAEIVISSDWRSYNTLERLKLLFRIHELDRYIIATTDQISGHMRDYEIEDYLLNHPDTGNFVILDDAYYDYFNRRFPDQFVFCRRIFDDECYQKALSVLQQPPEENSVPEPVLMLESLSDNAPVTKAEFSLDRISIILRYYRYSADDFISQVCKGVEKNLHIRHLTVSGLSRNLSFNEREEDVFAASPMWNALQLNSSITHLDISDNSLKDISSLIRALKARKCSLEALDLRQNSLNDNSLDILTDYISSISHPFSLMLQDACRFLEEEMVQVISENPHVTVFALDRQFEVFRGFGRRKSVPDNLKLESLW
ncbi:HAD domain-containing protein [Desulfococcaceae bacterium HSG8]|nr:HAD domain-containing protein [Desulfococcaceae bacterium HSG8]